VRRLRGLGRNARWLLLTEPGWSLPFPWVFFYQPVYAVSIGLSEVEYGAWLSVARALSIAAPLSAVPLASRLGLKRGFLLVDVLANVPFLAAMMAGTRELVAAGILSSSLLSVAAPLWETLLVEGTDPEALVVAYAVPSVIFTVGSSLTFVAGLLVKRYGVVGGYRIVLLVALAAYLAKTAALALKLEEPPRADPGGRPRSPARAFVRALRADRRLLLIVAYNVLSSVIFASLGYLSLYLTDERGARLPPDAASLVPLLSSAASLATLAAVSLRPPGALYLALAASAGAAAYTLYGLSAADPRLAFAAALLSGLRGAEFSVARACFLGLLGGADASVKGQAISVLYTLSNAISIPAPAAAGLLYSVHPAYVWLLAAACSLAQLALLAALARARSAARAG